MIKRALLVSMKWDFLFMFLVCVHSALLAMSRHYAGAIYGLTGETLWADPTYTGAVLLLAINLATTRKCFISTEDKLRKNYAVWVVMNLTAVTACVTVSAALGFFVYLLFGGVLR